MSALLGLLLAAAAGAMNVFGSMFAMHIHSLSRRALHYMIAGVAGFLLAASFMDLIPEIAEEAPQFLPYVFVGYLLVYILESLVPAHVHEHEDEAVLHVIGGWAASAGLAVHSFFDGITLMATLSTDVKIGLLIFGAIALHSLPVGFSLGSVLRASNNSSRLIWLASTGLLLSTVLGALFTMLTGMASPQIQFALLALASGSIIYIGATDMIPMTHHGGSRYTIVASLLGAALFTLLKTFLNSLTGGV